MFYSDGLYPNSQQGQNDMLILTQKISESIKIGDEVTVTVLSTKGNQARIGIKAPKDIAVHREEIYRRILEEQSANNSADEARDNRGNR